MAVEREIISLAKAAEILCLNVNGTRSLVKSWTAS